MPAYDKLAFFYPKMSVLPLWHRMCLGGSKLIILNSLYYG
jgi:hypothetical protein